VVARPDGNRGVQRLARLRALGSSARRWTSPERSRPAVTVLLLLQAIVLGLVQGLTEFLPVSSSGHLQGVPYLLGWDSGSLAFDVMVHAGTLIAVLAHFRLELWRMAVDAFGFGHAEPAQRRDARVLIGLLAIGTLPAAAAGLFLADTFEAAFASPRAVAGFLFLTALLLWSAERIRAQRLANAPVETRTPANAEADVPLRPTEGLDLGRDLPSLRGRDAVAIGLAQAVAIFPGVSRAGSTMAIGMALGLSRTAAARFSFLLSIPIIVGATIFTLADLGSPEAGTLPFGLLEIAVGAAVAAGSGYWAIRFLLDLVSRRDLLVFAKYVVVFATVLLVATFV
jgi:undecaprenyl-diphosphatase